MYATRTFKPTKRKTKPYIFCIVYNTERTLTLNQTRTPTFKPTDKN